MTATNQKIETIEIAAGEQLTERLVLPAVEQLEIFVGTDSAAHLILAQPVESLVVKVEAGARLLLSDQQFGGSARSDIQVDLLGEGADFRLNSVLVGAGEDKLQSTVAVNHFASGTTSRIITRGVLSEHARLVHQGLVKIVAGTTGCVSEQRAAALLLGRRARADLRPDLQIDSNDVRCSHAASTAGLDENTLYYLMSRGLSRAAATQMAISAFAAPALQGFCPREQEELFSQLTFATDVMVQP